MRRVCGACCGRCGHDGVAVGDADLAGDGRDGHAQGLRRSGVSGAAGAGRGSVQRAPVRVPGPSRSPGEGAVVERRWLLPVQQAAGSRPLRVAAGFVRGDGRAERGAAVDAAGRDRLAPARADVASRAGELRSCGTTTRRFDTTFGRSFLGAYVPAAYFWHTEAARKVSPHSVPGGRKSPKGISGSFPEISIKVWPSVWRRRY